MALKRCFISVPKLRETVIWNFYEMLHHEEEELFGKCKSCPWEIPESFFSKHLKSHPESWRHYLSELVGVLLQDEHRKNGLLLEKVFSDLDNPDESRTRRDLSNLKNPSSFEGFEHRVQVEYN